MNWTEQDLTRLGYYQHTDGNYYPHPPQPHRISNSEPKHVARKTLQVANEAQKTSGNRITLRITRFATRLLDEDNLAGSKLLTDQLRYAGILPSDDPGSTKIILDQFKVSKKTEERTEIEISY
jgi:hypothetical protein